MVEHARVEWCGSITSRCQMVLWIRQTIVVAVVHVETNGRVIVSMGRLHLWVHRQQGMGIICTMILAKGATEWHEWIYLQMRIRSGWPVPTTTTQVRHLLEMIAVRHSGLRAACLL